MTGIESLQSVQFITAGGKRLAVLNADNWEALIEWLDNLEDLQLAKAARQALQAAEGDRAKAGWLRWDDNRAAMKAGSGDWSAWGFF